MISRITGGNFLLYVKSKVNRFMFKQETGYLLNMLTLRIKNNEIAWNCQQHHARKFDTLFTAFFVCGLWALILSCVTCFITKTGHAVAVLNNALCLFFLIAFKLHRWKTQSTQYRDSLLISLISVPIVLSIVLNTGNLP